MTDLASSFSTPGGIARAWRRFGHRAGVRLPTSAMSAREILPVSSSNATDIVPAWAASLQQRIVQLARRSDGWDSYGARALQRSAIIEFYDVLDYLAHAVQSEPIVSLTTEGGLVASWENAQGCLEITVDPGQIPLISYEDAVKGTEWDGPLRACSLVEKWLWQTSAVR